MLQEKETAKGLLRSMKMAQSGIPPMDVEHFPPYDPHSWMLIADIFLYHGKASFAVHIILYMHLVILFMVDGILQLSFVICSR